jgi:hypothetical protein
MTDTGNKKVAHDRASLVFGSPGPLLELFRCLAYRDCHALACAAPATSRCVKDDVGLRKAISRKRTREMLWLYRKDLRAFLDRSPLLEIETRVPTTTRPDREKWSIVFLRRPPPPSSSPRNRQYVLFFPEEILEPWDGALFLNRKTTTIGDTWPAFSAKSAPVLDALAVASKATVVQTMDTCLEVAKRDWTTDAIIDVIMEANAFSIALRYDRHTPRLSDPPFLIRSLNVRLARNHMGLHCVPKQLRFPNTKRLYAAIPIIGPGTTKLIAQTFNPMVHADTVREDLYYTKKRAIDTM